MLLAFHGFGDGEVGIQFAAYLGDAPTPHRCSELGQVRRLQLWIEASAKGHVALKQSVVHLPACVDGRFVHVV